LFYLEDRQPACPVEMARPTVTFYVDGNFRNENCIKCRSAKTLSFRSKHTHIGSRAEHEKTILVSERTE